MALIIEQLSPTRISIHDGSTSLMVIDTTGGVRIDGAFKLGTQQFTAAQLDAAAVKNVETLTDDGAITIKNGVVELNKAGAIAATLANPTAGTDDFNTLTILALTAQANTVTVTGGFGNGGGGEDVATFSGAIGDNLNLMAYNGYWYITGVHQVTVA